VADHPVSNQALGFMVGAILVYLIALAFKKWGHRD